jgi:Outer membrane protein beta-barrel domain
MWNLQNDKELDKLSRDAADNYPLDHSPDSWSKLHLRLEAEMPTERRRRYLLFFLLFLVVGAGGFWLNRMNTDDSAQPKIASEAGSPQNGLTPSNNTEQPNNNNPGKASASPGVEQQSAETQQIASQPREQIVVQNTDKPINQLAPGSVTANSAVKSKSPVSNARKNTKKGNNKAARDEGIQEEMIALQGNTDKEKKIASSTVESVKSDDETALSKVDDNKQKSLDDANKGVQEEAPKQENNNTSKTADAKSKVNSRWTFGAVYAPDISTVKFTHSQPLGLNLGVVVEYRLSKTFSLQSGLIYTKKNYKMYGDEYHPPKGSWFDYVNLEDVTGSCMMFDIPLNVRYNAVRKKSSNIFVSAGLSTYLMREENYSYFYYYNTVPTTRDKNYEANSEYLFSILNISAGYEKKLSNAFSLQVEPFFKQPLTGLGFGEINLNSAGIYFSLRYNPLMPAKKTVTANK